MAAQTMRIERQVLGILFAVLLVLTAAVVWKVLTAPRCLQSHVEQRWVDYYCATVEISSVSVGDISVPVYGTQCYDAHWEPVTVCDQWEVER